MNCILSMGLIDMGDGEATFMTTEIYYFSGTGNSLFIAKEIQKRLPDAVLLPMVGMLHREKIETKGRTVGLVFPVHALTNPIVVRKFLRKADFASADYVFAVVTRLGTVYRGFMEISHMLKKKGKQLSAQLVLNMGNNDSRTGKYTVPTPEDLKALENSAISRLDPFIEAVRTKTVCHEKGAEEGITFGMAPWLNAFMEKLTVSGISLSEHTGGVNYFYADDKCIGCGMCEKICLSGKIRMQESRPVWGRKPLCYMCFACLNYCPKQAVQIKDIIYVKSQSKTNGRYPHPYASAKEIAVQKEPV
jgi:ferredoxin